jgi:hypothetical protein
MFTGAKAMAVQNYLTVKTQRQLLTFEIAREKWEIENKPDSFQISITMYLSFHLIFGKSANYVTINTRNSLHKHEQIQTKKDA